MNNNISIHARSFTAAFSTEALACPPGTRWHHVLLLCQQLFESVTVDMHVHKVTRESAQRHLLTFQRQFCPTTLVHLPETVLPNDTRSPSRDSSAQRHSFTIQRQCCYIHHRISPEPSLPLAEKFGSPYLGEEQQPQEQRLYPFLSCV